MYIVWHRPTRNASVAELDAGTAGMDALPMKRPLWCLLLVSSAWSVPLVHPDAPRGIDWFNGSVDAAFATAQREHKPVFLFWGAVWCPWCQQLKATVFSRRDFQEKAKLFVPMYLDGDDPGAQKYGDEFHVLGYPTVVVLDGQRHEIMRLAGDMDVSAYANVLNDVLADVQPVDQVLAAAATHPLSLGDCRRLAFNGWGLEDDPADPSRLAAQLSHAVSSCPAGATPERARLVIFAAAFATEAQSAALKRGRPGNAALNALIDQVAAIVRQPALAAPAADALQELDLNFFKAVRARGPQLAVPFQHDFIAIMDAAASDPRYAIADQIGAVGSELLALQVLGDGQIPKDVALAARQRVDAALAKERNPVVRSAIIDAALTVYDELGQTAEAYQVVKAEEANSKTPYYYEADLAELAEELHHKDEALMWFDQSYRESKGPATRFQWGQRYLNGLMRLVPNDAARIQQVGIQVLGELDGPDRIYRRARVRLHDLDGELQRWNTAAHGKHQDVLNALHGRMQQICIKIPAAEAARGSCDAFLHTSA
jgi:thioredoxin-related protein